MITLKLGLQSYETILLALKKANYYTKKDSMLKLHTTAFEKVLNEIDIFREDEEIKEKD